MAAHDPPLLAVVVLNIASVHQCRPAGVPPGTHSVTLFFFLRSAKIEIFVATWYLVSEIYEICRFSQRGSVCLLISGWLVSERKSSVLQPATVHLSPSLLLCHSLQATPGFPEFSQGPLL